MSHYLDHRMSLASGLVYGCLVIWQELDMEQAPRAYGHTLTIPVMRESQRTSQD